MKFLLGTKKPLLNTAHSKVDADRDGAILGELLSDTEYYNGVSDVVYFENPYASRMCFKDPFPTLGDEVTEAQIVRPNHFVSLLLQ